MNHISTLTRSRWLLLTLFTLLVGVSPAWAQQALPYNYDFEDADELANWSLVSCAANTGRNNTTKRNGSWAFRFYYNTNPPQYLISPELTGTANGVEVTFYYKSHSSGTETFHVGYSTTTAETSAFTFGDEISISYQSTWSTYNNTFPAGTKYVAIKYTSYDKYYLYIDDFSFTAPPTCIKPTGLTSTDITSSSVDLSWTSTADNFQIQYKKTSDGDWTLVNDIINATTYTLSGLEPATNYQARVRTYCSLEDQSDWTEPVAFTTDCATITSFPFTENFNGLTAGIPMCWNNTDGTTTTDSYKWNFYATGHDGACARFNSYNNSNNLTNMLKTPAMSYAQNAPMQLKFWYKNPTGGDFSVYISNDGGATYSTALAGCTGLTGASSWTEKVVDLPTDTYYDNVVIVFKGTSNYGSGDAYIYLDDVTVLEKANAPEMKYEDGDFDFGVVDKDEEDANIITHIFTVKNSGLAAVSNLSITSNSADFTVGSGYATSIAAKEAGVDGSMTFTVTLNTATAGYKTGIITISADGYEGEDALKFNVSGAIMKSGTSTEEFTTAIPSRWDNASGWTISSEAAYCSGTKTISTSKVDMSSGDFLVIKVKGVYDSSTLTVKGSKDGGEPTTLKTINKANDGLNTSNYVTVVVPITTDIDKLIFTGYYVYIDEIAGIVYDANDPAITVTTDEEGNTSIASASNYDFGTQTTEATKDYYIWNTGTGTLAVTNITVTGGYTVSPTSGNVAAGEKLHITVTQPAPATTDGFLNGTLTIASTGLADFTVDLSGFSKDEAKVFVNFADGWPAGWNNGANWSTNNGGYSYQSSYSTPSALTSSKMVVAENASMTFLVKKYSSWYTPSLNVKYSTNGEEWNTAKELTTEEITADWNKITIDNIPEGTYNLKFEGNNIYLTNLYGFAPLADDPVMEVYNDVDAKQASGSYTLDFGMLTTQAGTKTFKIKNANTGTLSVTGIAVPDGYTVKDGENAASYPINITAGNTKTLTLELGVATAGLKNGNVVISATDQEDFTITAKGYVADLSEGVLYENFSTANVPDGWEVTGNAETWTFAGEGAVASFYSTKGYLTTPALIVENTTDVFAYQAKSRYNGNLTLIVEKSFEGGEWTTCQSTNLTSADNGVVKTYTITGLEAGNYKLRFKCEDYTVLAVNGFKVNDSDPQLAVFATKSDLDALSDEVNSGTTKNFGWANTAQTATYYLQNANTGTLTIENVSSVDGFTTTEITNENKNIVAGEFLTFVVTMTNGIDGVKSGNITITTNGGNFTIPVKGFVYGDRNLIDFSSAAQTAGWNKGTWTIDENVASVAAASTMQTTGFIVNANEKLYVEAKRTADNYSTGSLSYSYSTNNGESWTDGESALFSATGSSDYDTYTISDIAGNEERTVLIRFNGAYAAINRIYGFEAIHVAEMVVSQTEAIAFGMQTAETTETSFTISNANGSKTLEGLSVTLGKTGEDAEYEVRMEKNDAAFTGTEIAVGEVVTVYVKQLFDINKLGAKSDVLTIAATDQTPVAINLSGATRDASKLYVDFDGSNDWPAAIASHGANWEVYAGYARQTSTTASSLVLAPLTISQASEALHFKASRNSNDRDLTVRYTTNGGVTWNDYNFGTNETPVTSLKEQITSSFSDFEITNIPNGTVAFDFYGKSIKLDNITADYNFATAPLVAFTKVTDNISDANLTADAEATYTLANNGNANYVGTVAKANVNVAISGEGVTYENNTLTIPAGKTAEITVTMPFAAPYGAKNGSMTITSESWVGEVAVNYTANLIDPDAINVDFASAPAGWYNAGWTVNGSANVYSGLEQELITEQYAAEEGKNVLSFKAKAQSGNEGTLKVYTSTDRKTWSEPTEFTLSGEYATKSLDALADGNYYVKFVSLNANIDDLTGLKKIAAVPEHDLYVSTSSIPTATKVPETSITATATVYSLRANEEGVSAKLFFDNVEVAAADAQDISLNGSKTFTLTGNVPATEKTYHAKIVVYYGDNSVAFETLTTNVEVQHTRTLNIATFTRTDGDGALDADVNNQVSPAFSVTVENTGTTAGTPTVKIYQGENVVATATAAAEVAAGATSDAIALTATNMSAGEGGEMAFTAKAFWTAEDPEAKATSASDIVITINAAAPKFALYDSEDAPVANETAYDYGLTRTKIDKVFTIKNEGTKTLQLTSVVAPTGFTATAVTNENKNIAVNGELAITISLDPSEGLGKKNGNVVINYNVNGTPATFTLAVSGRSIAENTWVEQFDTEIPTTWQNTGWTVENGQAYSGGYNEERTLMTPRLAAEANEELTFDATFRFTGYTLTVEYSTDKTTWNSVATINDENAGEQTFTAPAAGNYYLRFTGTRYAQLDNFIGFALNIPAHDMELAASSVPTTGKRLNSYVATVTLKENAGKNEDITAELWVAGAKVNATADVTSVGANSNATVVTLTWEPQTTMDAVDAYVKVTYAGGTTLETTPVTLTIAEVYTLSENSSDDVEAVINETVMLQRTFAAGWNTICLPFAVADNTAIETLFGAGAKVFNFKNFANSMIEFEAVTSLNAATPYLIYVPAAITDPIRVNNVTITGLNTTAGTASHNSITFQGSYAPVAAGGLTDMYGVTTTNKLAKGNANTTMKGFRAYFKGSLAGARIYTFDDATGISHVYQAAEVFGDDDRVYNMNGQHVENAKKGVYIVNGRKVVIK